MEKFNPNDHYVIVSRDKNWLILQGDNLYHKTELDNQSGIWDPEPEYFGPAVPPHKPSFLSRFFNWIKGAW